MSSIISLPDYKTTAAGVKFTADMTEKLGKLTRCIIDLSDEFIMLPQEAIFTKKATYFISVIKLPRSLHSLGVSILEIKNVDSIKKASSCLYVVASKTSLIAKDVFDILKGMKAFGLLDERYFVVFDFVPVLGSISVVFIVGQLYQEIVERANCQIALETYNLENPEVFGQVDAKRDALLLKLKKSNVSVAASALNVSGMALIALSPFVLAPVTIPAQMLLTLSAMASLRKVLL